jgi:hypothetical protein
MLISTRRTPFRVGCGTDTQNLKQADEGIIAQRGDGFQRHVSGALDGPFVVLLEQQRRSSIVLSDQVGLSNPTLPGTSMTAREALARYSAVEGARASGFAYAELHH